MILPLQKNQNNSAKCLILLGARGQKPGKTGFGVELGGTMVGNGVNIPLNSAVVGWFNSNYLPLGSTGGTDYVVVTGTAIIPSSVRINDTATIYTATRYSNSTKQITQGTQTYSYVVEADTSSTALLTLISIDKNTFGTTTSTSSEQMRITTSGTFVRTKDTALTSAGILNITY